MGIILFRVTSYGKTTYWIMMHSLINIKIF
jgi:hypothetical protein